MTDAAALYRLLAWLSPSFPVGAYAYSQGIEWAVEDSAITDRETLLDWIRFVLLQGSGRSDAILFAHAHRAASTSDVPRLHEVAELAAALVSCAERKLETTQQGASFATAISASWPAERLSLFRALGDVPLTYPVAVAMAAAAHDVPLDAILPAYLQALAANLVSAGVRLVPLGQTDGQRATAALEQPVADCAAMALDAPLDAVGGCAFLADIAAMRHETQHTRLFRS
jgi:urease accessory protein